MWLKLTQKSVNRDIIINTEDISSFQYSEGDRSFVVFKNDKSIQCDQSIVEIWNAIYRKEPCVDLTKTK